MEYLSFRDLGDEHAPLLESVAPDARTAAIVAAAVDLVRVWAHPLVVDGGDRDRFVRSLRMRLVEAGVAL